MITGEKQTVIIPRMGLEARKIYIDWHRREKLVQEYEELMAGVWKSAFHVELPAVLRGLRDHATLVAASEEYDPIFTTVIKTQKTVAKKTAKKLKTIYIRAGKAVATDTAVHANLQFPGFPKETAKFLNTHIPKIVGDINKTTRKMILTQIAQGVKKGETLKQIAARIKQTYANFTDSRAYRIAKHETSMIAALSEHDMFAELPLDKNRILKTWHNAQDDRVRDQHLIEKETVKFPQKFSNGLRFPKDPEGEPGNIINCRCYVSYRAT